MEVGISIMSFDFYENQNLENIMEKIYKIKSDILCFQNIDLLTFNSIFIKLFKNYRFFKSHFNYIQFNNIGNIILCSLSTISRIDINMDHVIHFEKSNQKKSIAVIKINNIYFMSTALENGNLNQIKKYREVQMINLYNLIKKIRYCVICGVFYYERFYNHKIKDVFSNHGTWHFDRYIDSISKPYHRIMTKYIHPLRINYFWVGSSNNDILLLEF